MKKMENGGGSVKLPVGRIKRVKEFGLIEESLEPLINSLKNCGINTYISPVIKTLEEVEAGSPES